MSLETCFLCILTRIYLDWSNSPEIRILFCFLRHLNVVWTQYFVVVCCFSFVVGFGFCCFSKQKPSPLSWEFSLLTPSATCDSCALTGSFPCWAGCGSSAALLFCARIPKGESGDERCIKVTLKSTVPSAFWSLCCYGAMSSNISYWWIFAKLLCYWFLTVKKVPLLLYWHKCLEYMHCNS